MHSTDVHDDLIARKSIALVLRTQVFADMRRGESGHGAFMDPTMRSCEEKEECMISSRILVPVAVKEHVPFPREQQMKAMARALMISPSSVVVLALAAPLVIHGFFQKIAIIIQEDKVTVFLVGKRRMAPQGSNRLCNGERRIELADSCRFVGQ
jgi:hypothetical protein